MSKDKSDLSEQELERLVRFDDELRTGDSSDREVSPSDADTVDEPSECAPDAITVEMDMRVNSTEAPEVIIESGESPSDDAEPTSASSQDITKLAAASDTASSDESDGDEEFDEAAFQGTGSRALAFIHRVQQTNPHVVDDMAAEEVNGWLHIEDEHPKRLGRHEIIRRLGSGGFGVVFLAIDPELEREVALKVPRVETLINGQTRRRFLRESRMAAQLNHPNIATIFEAGSVGPVFYIASEHCPGGSIDQFLQIEAKGGRLDGKSTAHLIMALADAVEHAHGRGILHRDIKPTNILLDVQPEELPSLCGDPERLGEVARLVDFGLAKSLEVSDDVTKSGIMLGTPAFTAPEMVTRRHEAGAAADVYSLGATMYHLLTGDPPLKKASDFETLVATQNEDAEPPSSVANGVHRDLDAICLKCLEKQPEFRYASAGDLRDDLERFLSGRPIAARRTTRLEKIGRWCRRNSMVAMLTASTALLLGVAAGSLVYTWQVTSELKNESRRIDGERMVFGIHAAFNQDRILGRALVREPWQSSSELPTYDLSADSRVVLIGFGDMIRFWDIVQLEELATLPVKAQPATFAQSGLSLLACTENNEFGRYPIERFQYDDLTRWQIKKPEAWERSRAEGQGVVATSSDGNRVALSLEEGLLRIRDLVSGADAEVELESRVESLSFSADGAMVAVALEPLDEVRIISSASQSVVRSLNVNRPKFVAFSPDGQTLAITEGEILRVRNVVDWSIVQEFASLWNPQFAFSPDSKLIAVATSHDVISLLPTKGATRTSRAELTIKIPSNLSISKIMFSRDKRYLVAGTEEGLVYAWDLPSSAEKLQSLNVDWQLLCEQPSSVPPDVVPMTVNVP